MSMEKTGVKVGGKEIYLNTTGLKVGSKGKTQPAGTVFGSISKGTARFLRKRLRSMGRPDLAGARREGSFALES